MTLHKLMTIALAIITTSNVFADDWPQWLGPNREPVWRETDIVNTLPKIGPPLRWKAPVGGGYSGPAVAGGRVYLMDRVSEVGDLKSGKFIPGPNPFNNDNFVRRLLPGKERVICLDEANGNVVWTHEYDCPYTSVAKYAIGPRCTPTVDGDRVYTLGSEGHLLCLSTTNGDVIWSINFQEQFDLKLPFWGIASHPLIDGDRLICMVGGTDTTCVAFDKSNGKVVWSSLSSAEPGYCPPTIADIDGERQLVVWNSDAVCGLDPETGHQYWTVPFKPMFAMSIGAPQFAGRSMFLMGFNRKSALIEIAQSRRQAKVVWNGNTNRGIGGVLNTAIIHANHIYACGSNGRYFCVELKSGEGRWSTFDFIDGKRPKAWGNVFTVKNGERYFHLNDTGDLIIATMSPSGFQEISRARLIEPTHQVGNRTLVWSHPAFANRSIYLRNDRELRCYSLAK